MATEKQLSAISAIVRALGKIEGVASGLERKYSTPLLDAVERIEFAIKEITDGNLPCDNVIIEWFKRPASEPPKEEAQQDCTYNKNGHCMGQKLMPECDAKNCDRRK